MSIDFIQLQYPPNPLLEGSAPKKPEVPHPAGVWLWMELSESEVRHPLLCILVCILVLNLHKSAISFCASFPTHS